MLEEGAVVLAPGQVSLETWMSGFLTQLLLGPGSFRSPPVLPTWPLLSYSPSFPLKPAV